MAIDDASRFGDFEVVPDGQQSSSTGISTRASAWLYGYGFECRHLMADKGPAYITW